MTSRSNRGGVFDTKGTIALGCGAVRRHESPGRPVECPYNERRIDSGPLRFRRLFGGCRPSRLDR